MDCAELSRMSESLPDTLLKGYELPQDEHHYGL